MATPAAPLPVGEPFSEALAEAAQSAAMAMRLLLTLTDAVRRAAQKHRLGKEEELGEDAANLAPGWAEARLRPVLDAGVLSDLMAGADWPQMARQLVSLQQAGVDMAAFLPQLGGVASTVQRAVAANSARIKSEGTDRWADLLRATTPEGMVRDGMLASPAWPDMAAAMDRLNGQGVDVTRFLTDAHAAGIGVDRAIAAVLAAAPPAPAPASAPATAARAAAPGPDVVAAARSVEARDPWAPPPAAAKAPAPGPAPVPGPPAPAPVPVAAPVPVVGPVVEVSEDARRSWGPLTAGLKVPLDLDLGDRAKALAGLGVNLAAHAAMVSMVKDVLPEHEAGLLIGARTWPLLAARMQQLGDSQGQKAVGAHLARLGTDTSWKQGPASALVGRLVGAAHDALTTPPGPVSRVRVSADVARSRSTTVSAAAPGQAAAAEAAVPAHRQPASRVRGTGRAR
ncbi:hypothetical protein [Streptomyces sp. H34-S4]|uniref:hypothetical protein n=1 Tax=Streptomyces sp. H34-S4 TaxID=2996463 RepID=UPI00226E7EAB|nr:hypothetical protein [Streptomyces sp. H34-S4]MCY0937344.1 hypothetical protein [Streptomyces sp. H34-S4]